MNHLGDLPSTSTGIYNPQSSSYFNTFETTTQMSPEPFHSTGLPLEVELMILEKQVVFEELLRRTQTQPWIMKKLILKGKMKWFLSAITFCLLGK